MSTPDKHAGCIRGFYIHGKSWYAKSSPLVGCVEEIMIGMYAPEGGSTGEFAVRWIDIGGRQPAPRLEVFDDAWHALASRFGDLLTWMATVDRDNVTPSAFAANLRAMGVEDRTARVRPPFSAGEKEYASWSIAP
jgi:hypothetical protein